MTSAKIKGFYRWIDKKEVKSMKKGPGIFQLIIALSFLLPSSFLSPASAENRIKVTVSILPQKYFVRKIGGDLVDISVMVLPGSSPATYEPRPKQMVKLTESRIYFAIGVPFETVWLKKFESFNSKMTIVATQAGIEKVPMKTDLHNNNEGGDNTKTTAHAGIKDPHIWLSPPLVMVQARNILKALLNADPANRETYAANYKAFIMELVELDLGISRLFADTGRNTRFMVFHPAWGYFARAYGLRQIPVEIEGKKPTPKGLQQLIRAARKDGIKVVFVQPQFSTKSAGTIAKAIGGRVVFADPLAVDWAKNLLLVARQFKDALR
jgi:zinc transport system substrate-binding protein